MAFIIEIADIDADQASLEGLAIRGIDIGLGETRAHREHEVRFGEQALGGRVGQRTTEVGRMGLGEDAFACSGGDEVTVQALDEIPQARRRSPRAAAGDDGGSRCPLEQRRHARDLLHRRRRSCRGAEDLDGKVGMVREEIERHAEVRGAAAARAVFIEHPPQEVTRLGGCGRRADEIEHRGHDALLIPRLVQHAPAAAERGARRRAGDHDQWGGVRVRLSDRGEHVADPRP